MSAWRQILSWEVEPLEPFPPGQHVRITATHEMLQHIYVYPQEEIVGAKGVIVPTDITNPNWRNVEFPQFHEHWYFPIVGGFMEPL